MHNIIILQVSLDVKLFPTDLLVKIIFLKKHKKKTIFTLKAENDDTDCNSHMSLFALMSTPRKHFFFKVKNCLSVSDNNHKHLHFTLIQQTKSFYPN